ncbi:MAG: glycoside hydrolase family 25 protein [Hyphomicrobiales bacterium]|nr:glycoside hydrolase family 25 protein [Hyphomicrobiales bacterium]
MRDPFAPRRLAALALLAASLAVTGCSRSSDSTGGIRPSAYTASSKANYMPTGSLHAAKPSEAIDHARNFEVHGIDVSKYQGRIDWNAVAASNVHFAWIKATEGAEVLDTRFRENWEGARAAGVPRGAYHFVYWCRPWRQEMAWFEHNVPRDPDALPPVLDVEATPKSRSCHRTLYPQQTVAEMRAMLHEMERHFGKKPIIYTTVDFYEAILSDGSLGEYPMWVRSTKHRPHVRYGSRKWHFWQYQSDGAVSGIAGRVDRNVFHGSRADFRRWLASNASIADRVQSEKLDATGDDEGG